MVSGTISAFKVGLYVTLLQTIIGVIWGTIAAYYGGIVDQIMMRITDLFYSMPFLIIAMIFATILGRGLDKIIIALITFGLYMPE